MAATLDRLERAVELETHEEDLLFMTALENYSFCGLGEHSQKTRHSLGRRDAFSARSRLQIKAAMVACDKRYFRGMLPIGIYRLENKVFEVARGVTVQVKLAEPK